MTFKTFLDKAELNELPAYVHDKDIILITETEKARLALESISQFSVIGFDIEVKPVFVKGDFNLPSLLQLATQDCTYLFRLNRLGLLPEMKEILSREDILKVGVAVKDDVKLLLKISSFEPKGFFDLAVEAKAQGYENMGLRGLLGVFLGQRLLKGAKITNWEKPQLTEAQVKYAASDARASLLIYQKLMAKQT